jgi:peptide/nickel transport system permease protein
VSSVPAELRLLPRREAWARRATTARDGALFLLVFAVRRLLFAAIVVLATAVTAYGGIRALKPSYFPGEGLLDGLWGDLERAFLHFDFGEACLWAGCPEIRRLWLEGMGADLWLLGGAVVIGVGGGVTAGLWCAMRPRSPAARAFEALAMVAYCAPVYVVGLGLMILFNPTFGAWPLPAFFEPAVYASPFERPWDWFRSLLVPWFIVAAPLGAACLRITVATIVDELESDHVRTGVAKGLSHRRVVSRHAGPAAYNSVATFVWASVPWVVTNMVLVEWVYSVPGFFRYTQRATGKDPRYWAAFDIPMLQALAIWAAVLIVLVTLLADLVLARMDPRVRAATRGGG